MSCWCMPMKLGAYWNDLAQEAQTYDIFSDTKTFSMTPQKKYDGQDYSG